MLKTEWIKAHAHLDRKMILEAAKADGIELTTHYLSKVLSRLGRTSRGMPVKAKDAPVTRDEYRAEAKASAGLLAKHGATLTELGKFLSNGGGEEFSPMVRVNLEAFARDAVALGATVTHMHDVTMRRGRTYLAEQADEWERGTLRMRKDD